ncbi:MAG: sigma-70 family RNA polymerase sigma factor [Bacteroidota bacterium]
MVQVGDERALAELYGRYAKKLVRYFHRMLWRDENKAQDFLHDLFIKIIEHPQQFNAERKFSTWIYSAAFNMCKNEYRKQNFRNSQPHELPEDSVVIIQPDADQQEFQRTLEIVLNHSEENDRNLFILRHELDMPLAQIAIIMDCPEGTIKSRLFYLKKKLALQLQKFNPAIN